MLLAATLGANYGIYGPAFELLEHAPVRPGSEEYLDSEKYEIRHWDLDRPDSLRPLIARVNAIRNDESRRCKATGRSSFTPSTTTRCICYTKESGRRRQPDPDRRQLDPHYTQSGFVTLPLARA